MTNRKGFTLIELLVAVTIAGVLTGIALPKVAAARDRAYVSSLQNDISNGVLANEVARSNGDPMLSGIVQPGASLPVGCSGEQCLFTASPNNTVTFDFAGTAAAISANSTKTFKRCSYYQDGIAAVPPASSPNTLTCQ